MLWIKAFHLIFVIAWFAGLFYLPRLFVYHTETTEAQGYARFCLMEHKLFYYIMMPAGILATGLGFWLFFLDLSYYAYAGWMHVKLMAVGLLWAFQGYCWHLVRAFKEHRNPHSSNFYRYFNEIPTVLLFAIVMMVVIRP